MYTAKGNEVLVYGELFLTVHSTEDCTRTPEEQAVTLAEILNGVSNGD